MVEQMYTVVQAAKRLATSRFTINRWIADGTLKAVDINPRSVGRAQYRVKDSVLQELVDRLEANTVRRAKGKAPERKPKPLADADPKVTSGRKRSALKQTNRIKEFV